MKNTPEDKDKIALCNIRKIIDAWNSPEESLSARIKIDKELNNVNM
jgi:hypothetical protein